MFKFSNDIPLQLLLGQAVWEVCFSNEGLNFVLENRTSIRIYNRREFYKDNACNYIINDKRAIQACGLAVSGINVINASCMSFTLGSDIVSIMNDRDGDFEKYAFYIGGTEYIV